MAGKKKEPTKVPVEVEEHVEPVEVKKPTHELEVLSSANERGLNSTKFEHVDVKYLYADNYRINCYKDNYIKASYFISFSVKEGIYYCSPEINHAV